MINCSYFSVIWQVCEWLYPLMAMDSPVLLCNTGVFMFPDMMAPGPGYYVGVVLSSELPSADRDVFQDLLSQMTDLRVQVSVCNNPSHLTHFLANVCKLNCIFNKHLSVILVLYLLIQLQKIFSLKSSNTICTVLYATGVRGSYFKMMLKLTCSAVLGLWFCSSFTVPASSILVNCHKELCRSHTFKNNLFFLSELCFFAAY